MIYIDIIDVKAISYMTKTALTANTIATANISANPSSPNILKNASINPPPDEAKKRKYEIRTHKNKATFKTSILSTQEKNLGSRSSFSLTMG